METKITNIVLLKDRFQVFVTIDGNDESNIFMPYVVAQDIKDWVAERVAFYNELKDKEEDLRAALINKDLEIRTRTN